MIETKCKQCGDTFLVKPSVLKRGRGKFCSVACYSAWRAANAKGTTKIPATCLQCGEEFLGKRCSVLSGRKKFCSKECMAEWMSKNMSGINSPNYKSQIASCPVCGEKFSRAPWEVRDGRHKYCSRECFNQWQSENRSGKNHPNWGGDDEKRECVICGERFTVRPSSEQKTCGSQECMDASRKPKISGENHYAWVGGPEERECEWCGSPFFIHPGVSQRFCSQKCYGSWRSKYMSGKNSPLWKPDKQPRDYPPEFSKPLKRKIRRRDGYKCAICRLYGNHVHHLDYTRTNNDETNLLTLCPSCHGVANFNRDYWQLVLSHLLSCRLSLPAT